MTDRLHTCAACGKSEPWGDAWKRYGSIHDEDTGRTVVVCSAECAKQAPAIHARQPAPFIRPWGYQ